MIKLQFKTTINCSACVANVTPVLNAQKAIEHWEVDTTTPDKVLTVTGGNLNAEDVIDSLKKIGYQASLKP